MGHGMCLSGGVVSGIRNGCLDVNGISGNELADDGLALFVKASIMNEGKIHLRHAHRISYFG